MNKIDYDAYIVTMRYAVNYPQKLNEALVHVQNEWEKKKAMEENKIISQIDTLSQKKQMCIQQYDEIRRVCVANGLDIMPAHPSLDKTNLFVSDALANQNRLANEAKSLFDDYRRELVAERQRERARKEAEKKACEMAEAQARMEAEKRKQEEQEAALNQQLIAEKEKKRREERQQKLKQLIPIVIVIAVVLLIISLK